MRLVGLIRINLEFGNGKRARSRELSGCLNSYLCSCRVCVNLQAEIVWQKSPLLVLCSGQSL